MQPLPQPFGTAASVGERHWLSYRSGLRLQIGLTVAACLGAGLAECIVAAVLYMANPGPLGIVLLFVGMLLCCMGTAAMAGLLQLFWAGPLIVWAKLTNRPQMMRGVATAAVTLLVLDVVVFGGFALFAWVTDLQDAATSQ